jgi:hypothetical protein
MCMDSTPNLDAWTRQLRHLLGELERLADVGDTQMNNDLAAVRTALGFIAAGDAVNAADALRHLSPWAGEIAVECGQR